MLSISLHTTHNVPYAFREMRAKKLVQVKILRSERRHVGSFILDSFLRIHYFDHHSRL